MDLFNQKPQVDLGQGSQTRGPRTSEKIKISKQILSCFAYFSK